MKKKNKKQFRKQAGAIPEKQVQQKPVPKGENGNKLNMLLFGIIALTFIAYLPALKNGFLFWDDPEYILKNPYISNVPFMQHFTGYPQQGNPYYMGNYHPLTMVSLSIDHSFFGTDAFGYHFMNLLFHLLNTVLVFFFVHLLFDKRKVLTAAGAAILFGIHPMHVESVAWVSERKDVLHTLFFLLALVAYLYYIRKDLSIKYLLLSLALFALSLFSKGQAVTLPLVLLLIDLLNRRKMDARMIAEKIPFFILSGVFSLLAIKAQHSISAVNPDFAHSLDSFFWASYGLAVYLIKSILPVNLSGVYPYPFVITGSERLLPLLAYLAPLIFLPLIYFSVRSFRNDRVAAFGILFFIATIIPMLKFIPVGDAIVAERYTYIPYIGLFIIAGYLFERFSGRNNKNLVNAIGIGIVLALAFLTFNRTKVWKDTYSFWNDVAEKNPDYWRSYYCMGQQSYDEGQQANDVKKFDQAVDYYTKSGQMDKYAPPMPYLMRGVAYLDHLNKPELAIADFKKVLSFPNKGDQSQIDGRQDLGLAYYRVGKYDSAMAVYNELLAIAPANANAYMMRGLIHSMKNEIPQSFEDYNKAIGVNPGYSEAYLNRGVLFTDKTNEPEKGLADFKRAYELNPNNADAPINIGIALYKMRQFQQAIQQYNSVLQAAPNNGRVYYLLALVYSEMKDYRNAVANAYKARSLGMAVDDATLKSWEAMAGK